MNIVTQESEAMGLTINTGKSVTMTFSKSEQPPQCLITIGGEQLKQVESFSYLGSLLTSDGRSDKEIKRRIGIAKSAFESLRRLITNRKISIDTRKRLIRTYVWSTLTYGAETWTVSSAMNDRLSSFEMWCYRRMMRISWIERKTNEEVLRMVSAERELVQIIRKRQLQFLGHVVRRKQLEHLVLTGMVSGKRARGRQRLTFLTAMKNVTGKRPTELLHLCDDRERWRQLTASTIANGQ